MIDDGGGGGDDDDDGDGNDNDRVTALGFPQLRRWQEAFALVDELKKFGFTIDVVKLNSVLKACSTAKQWEGEFVTRSRKQGRGGTAA